MTVFLYIFFFLIGLAIGLYLYKNKQKTLSELMLGKSDELLESRLTEAITENHDTVPAETTETLKKTADNLYIVNELGRKVTASLNLELTFNQLYTTINSMMDAAVLELCVRDGITGSQKLYTNSTTGETTYTNHMSDWCFKNNREVFLADAENDYARYVFKPLVLPDGRTAKSVIIFPIINRDVVSGTLCVISFQKNNFNDYHREIIRLLLGYISVAIENALTHEELNHTRIRAEQSEKFKEQFLANMSHEIRTPINAVTGMTRLLLEKQPRQDQLRYLESIRNASDSLLVIINDILDLSKIEAGKIEFEELDFSFNDLLRNVKDLMQFKAEEKGLAFEENPDKSIPAVLIGDPTRLTQILINLVGNAIKFTPKGKVAINVMMVNVNQSGTDALISTDELVRLRIEVTDTGIGMTADQQARLFQDYAQAGPETSRKYGGTGLGLSISQKLVRLLGGTIEVKSESGKGSAFSFELNFPISKNKTVSIKEKIISKEMLQELKGIRVLLADDNEYNRIVIRETLQLKIEDIVIEEAVDGTSAIEMAGKNNYDIILMDLVMPGLDGLEVTQMIRNELPSPKNKTQVVALTASVVKSEIDKCYSAGMNGFIPKPFKNYELFGAIYKALNNQKELVFEDVVVNKQRSKPKGNYVDLNYLYEFTEGDETRTKRYIDLFLTKTPLNIETINKALELNDFEKIRITAHSMKPQLQAAGFIEGVELVEAIEQCCRENPNSDHLQRLINELGEVCGNALKEMKELINEL